MFDVDIHHHRPLMNSRDSYGRSSVSADHYAWYAYEWNNLVVACTQCLRFKSTQFPTENERIQPFTPWFDADAEIPALLDPCADNVYEHLAFKRNGRCIEKTRRGKSTISVLKLNRSDLVKRRSYAFVEIYGLLERLRGAHYDECLSAIKVNLGNARGHIGAARAWISAGVTEISGKKLSPEREADFDTDLAGFLSLINDENWANLSTVLRGKEDYVGSVLLKSNADDLGSKDYSARVISISLENFKGINQLHLNFEGDSARKKGVAPAAVLLGENSTGKSSILQALAIGVMSPKLRGQLKVGFDEFIRSKWQRSSSGQFETNVGRETESSIKVSFDNGQINEIKIRRDGSIEGDDFVSGLVLAYGAHRSFDKENLGTGYFRRVSSVESLYERNKLIPHSLHWLESVDEYEFVPVARAMREILNLKGDEEIFRSDSGEVFIRSQVGDVSLLRLSDGYRSLIAMSLDIIRNMMREWGNLEDSHGLVLIDEIETHLHPRWKMQVVSALRNAMPQVQFIYTTHDPLCLRGMLNGEVHVLVKDEDGMVKEMTGLPDINGMRAEQLLTSEFFGLASTVDPLIERNLDRMIMSGARSQENDGQFSSQLEGFSLIGDTPEKQIVNQALRLHILEELRSKRLDRSEIREEAVELILQRLRASTSGGAK